LSHSESNFQHIRDQITTWGNRAAMAKQMGNEQLAQQALDKKRQYENALARLQEFEIEK
jgi:phage shock protein A